MLDRIYSESRTLPESLKAPFRVDSAEFGVGRSMRCFCLGPRLFCRTAHPTPDRKSTRLNSSHLVISYAVLCLKKKTNKHTTAMVESPSPVTALLALLLAWT